MVNKKFLAGILAALMVTPISVTAETLMVTPISVSAVTLSRAEIDPFFAARGVMSTIKDTVSGKTSSKKIGCTGNLVYYGSTGYSAETETEAACTTVKAIIYVDDSGAWAELDSDTQSNATSADAAGQYGTGTEDSQGYHYAKDSSGGTWYDYTSFSYDN